MKLGEIKTPSDLKRLNISELGAVCDAVRERIIDVVETNGGHLSSNLGTVELTVALHYVFDCPKDKIVFDVGHQSYAHKILTGRGEAFSGLRRNGGISGFPKPQESEYDAFYAGHASTSLSVALGLAESMRRRGEAGRVIAFIGDGALTGGLAYEALNAIGSEKLPIIIVLNDNEMSISKNVGAMSDHLTRLRVSKKYTRFKSEIRQAISVLPIVGDGIISLLEKSKRVLKNAVLSNKIFEAMGIKYYGPFDGHNVAELVDVFSQARSNDGPIIVHAVTDKGHGLKSAAVDPAHSHGISSAGAKDGAPFSDVLGEFLLRAAETDERITAVTAAMSIGTGLEGFAKRFPERFKDVGIAEEHATTYCAALAAGGLKPYFAVYSTFLQRAYDEILHDVCIGNYPVTFCIDRAGAVGADGVTHQGVFDLSYLLPMPNMTVMCPSDGDELAAMLEFSRSFEAPLAIRYPKSYAVTRKHDPVIYGKWETVKSCPRSEVYVLCAGGRMIDVAENAARDVELNIVNCRFVKPLDAEYLDKINLAGNTLITMEDNVAVGGFGHAVLAALNEKGLKARVINLAHADAFIDDRSVKSTLDGSGLCAENLINLVKNLE